VKWNHAALVASVLVALWGDADLAQAGERIEVTCEIDLTDLARSVPYQVGEPEPGYEYVVTSPRECKKLHGRVMPNAPPDQNTEGARAHRDETPRR